MAEINLTKNEQKIINFLADNPLKDFFTSEIAKNTKISLGGCHNALNNLKKNKIVWNESRGNMKFWRININNFVKQFRIAFLLNRLDDMIKKLKFISSDILLFGSGALGEYDKNSDIDLLIISNDKEGAQNIINNYCNRYPVKAIIKKPNEWHEMEIKDKELYLEIKKGIAL